MRPLAVTAKIIAVQPIPDADRIHSVTVDCGAEGTWRGVTPKGFGIGDRVVVFLQDALLPEDDPRFTFLASRKFRVSMRRFRGAPSECLILANDSGIPEIGVDVTELYRVRKYEKPLSESMSGEALGAFPTNRCPVTDEEHFQRVPEQVARMTEEAHYATEKADGTSCTAWVEEDGLHVCSRNLELREFSLGNPEKSNLYWRMARKYGMERLPQGLFLQFEIVGPGVQKNPLRLKENEIRVFSGYEVRARRYLPYTALCRLCEELELPKARLLWVRSPNQKNCTEQGNESTPTPEELLKTAEIEYAPGIPGEGIVIRALDSSWSFKVLNLLYKD